MSVGICFSFAVDLETYGKLHPYVFFQILMWEVQHKVYLFLTEVVYFGNYKDEADSEHIDHWLIDKIYSSAALNPVFVFV